MALLSHFWHSFEEFMGFNTVQPMTSTDSRPLVGDEIKGRLLSSARKAP